MSANRQAHRFGPAYAEATIEQRLRYLERRLRILANQHAKLARSAGAPSALRLAMA